MVYNDCGRDSKAIIRIIILKNAPDQEKGKPIERWGRKAMDLRLDVAKTARLPGDMPRQRRYAIAHNVLSDAYACSLCPHQRRN